MPKTISQISTQETADEARKWQADEVADFLARAPEAREQFYTAGDVPVERTYTAADIADTPAQDIGLPG